MNNFKNIAATLTILVLTLNGISQTWKPTMIPDTSGLTGFEDVYGHKKDMIYKSATLVDEENPQYTIVSYSKNPILVIQTVMMTGHYLALLKTLL